MEVVNEVVAVIKLGNLGEIDTVRNALHKVVQMETRMGYNQKLLSTEEREVLHSIASSLVGYNQVNEPPKQQPPQYKVVSPSVLNPILSPPEEEPEKKKSKKRVKS